MYSYSPLRGHESVSSSVQISQSSKILSSYRSLIYRYSYTFIKFYSLYTSVSFLFSHFLATAWNFMFHLLTGSYLAFPITYTSNFNSSIFCICSLFKRWIWRICLIFLEYLSIFVHLLANYIRFKASTACNCIEFFRLTPASKTSIQVSSKDLLFSESRHFIWNLYSFLFNGVIFLLIFLDFGMDTVCGNLCMFRRDLLPPSSR
jgi:hypothetical protein